MGLEGYEHSSDGSRTTDTSENVDPNMDAMSKLSLNDDGQNICPVVVSENVNKSNKENAPPRDPNHISSGDGHADIITNSSSDRPKTTSTQASIPAGGHRVEMISSDLPFHKLPWRTGGQSHVIKFLQKQPTTPLNSTKSVDSQEKDASHSSSAKIKACVTDTPPKAVLSGRPHDARPIEEMLSGLSLENEPWRVCTQLPDIKVLQKKPRAPPRDRDSEEEDTDEWNENENDTVKCPTRGPMFNDNLSKQRATPYRQPPSPWSGSDQTNSPGTSSDMSRSPMYASDSSQSPKPETVPRFQHQSSSHVSISPLIQNGGSCTVDESVVQGGNTSALPSSSSPSSDTECTLKAWKFLAGGSIHPVEAAAAQESCSSTMTVEPIVAISTMKDILSKSPQRDAIKDLGHHEEHEANLVLNTSSASPQAGYWYSNPPSLENSPECHSDTSDDISAMLLGMAPYVSEDIGLDDIASILQGPDNTEVVDNQVQDYDRPKCDGNDSFLDIYDFDTNTGFDTLIFDEPSILTGPSVSTPVTSQNMLVAQQGGNGSMPLNFAGRQIITQPIYTTVNVAPVPFEATSGSARAAVPPPFAVASNPAKAGLQPPSDVTSIRTGVPIPGAIVYLPEAICITSPNAALQQLPCRRTSPASNGNQRLPLNPSPSTVESKYEERMKQFLPILPRPQTGNVSIPRRLSESSSRGSSPSLQIAPIPVPVSRASSENLVGAGVHRPTLTANPQRAHARYGEEYLVLTADQDGDTNLHIAAANNNLDLARAILERNGNPRSYIDRRNNSGQTPLFMAVYSNNVEMVKYLLQNGADPNPSCGSSTPLHLLATRGPEFHEIGQILLQVPHIPLNTRNSSGFTALHLAVQSHSESNNMTNFIRMLLTSGADLTFTEPCSNKTALHMAVERENPALVATICESCNDISAAINCNSLKGTALHYAAMLNDTCENIQLAIVTTLLRHGGNPSMRCGYLLHKYPKDLVRKDRKKVKDLLKLNRK